MGSWGASRAAESAVARTEAQLALAVIVFRCGGIAGMLWVVLSTVPQGLHRLPVFSTTVLVGAVTVESALLCLACRRERRVRTWWSVADLATTIAGLIWWRLVAPADALYFMFPYSVMTSITYGVVLRRLWLVLGATLLVALANAVPEIGLNITTTPNAIYDAGSYFPNTLVAFAVARAMRSGGVELDAARAAAAEAAAGRLRTQHARVLHDRVLQTLEVLAAGPWLAGSPLHPQVVQESVWLRNFVAGSEADAPTGLLAGLRLLAERSGRDGLRVRLEASALEEDPGLAARLAAEAAGELLAAAGELLTNVRKHAGVDDAVLRVAWRGDEIRLSVLDQGCGFEPALPRMRTGLRQSVIARIEEVGGRVLIESAPGDGAYIELTVPLGERVSDE